MKFTLQDVMVSVLFFLKLNIVPMFVRMPIIILILVVVKSTALLILAKFLFVYSLFKMILAITELLYVALMKYFTALFYHIVLQNMLKQIFNIFFAIAKYVQHNNNVTTRSAY